MYLVKSADSKYTMSYIIPFLSRLYEIQNELNPAIVVTENPEDWYLAFRR